MMRILSKKWWVGLGILLLVLYVWPSSQTLAALSGCTANTTPNLVKLGSTNNINFSLKNDDSASSISWVEIISPASDYSISDVFIGGWTYSFNSQYVYLSGSVISPGTTQNFALSVIADNNPTTGNNWTILASDDPGGTNPTTCSGSQGLNTINSPIISNIKLLSTTDSSATISWTTNNPTKGNIDYGLTNSYGSATQMSSGFITSHQQTVSGLTANTGYHFMVYVIDQHSNTTYSSDNTFLTTAVPIINNNEPTSSPTVTTTYAQPHSVVVVNKKAPNADIIPPQITLITNLSKAYTTVPTLTGTASDNIAVAKVDYSTDGGQNWLPVDTLTTAGQSRVTFVFTPLLPLDGNYVIMVRATDSSGNTTTTAPQTLFIDNLPPLIGGNIVSVGPQVLQPSTNGTIRLRLASTRKSHLVRLGRPRMFRLMPV